MAMASLLFSNTLSIPKLELVSVKSKQNGKAELIANIFSYQFEVWALSFSVKIDQQQSLINIITFM